jgi:uncharacterized protein YceH (UPF0502 family)
MTKERLCIACAESGEPETFQPPHDADSKVSEMTADLEQRIEILERELASLKERVDALGAIGAEG